MAAGDELGYAEITADFTGTSTSLADVTGLSVTVDVGSRPIMIKFFATAGSDSAGTFGAALYLDEDGSDVGTMAGFVTASQERAVLAERRRNPSAGSHTYKIRYKQVTAGTMLIRAGTGAAAQVGPAFIQVIEI